MDRMNKLTLMSSSEKDTAFVAAAIAPLLRRGDAILLKGGLAGGKTKFVQALVEALGSHADVTSPTFTLAHFYPAPIGTVLHVDAYRLSSIAEYRDLGLRDYTDSCITAIEWGDKVEADFPDSLSIIFEFVPHSDTLRKLTFGASTERWSGTLRELRPKLREYMEA